MFIESFKENKFIVCSMKFTYMASGMNLQESEVLGSTRNADFFTVQHPLLYHKAHQHRSLSSHLPGRQREREKKKRKISPELGTNLFLFCLVESIMTIPFELQCPCPISKPVADEIIICKSRRAHMWIFPTARLNKLHLAHRVRSS